MGFCLKIVLSQFVLHGGKVLGVYGIYQIPHIHTFCSHTRPKRYLAAVSLVLHAHVKFCVSSEQIFTS